MKYDGYIKRQLEQIERFQRLEEVNFPKDFDFSSVNGLSTEVPNWIMCQMVSMLQERYFSSDYLSVFSIIEKILYFCKLNLKKI